MHKRLTAKGLRMSRKRLGGTVSASDLRAARTAELDIRHSDLDGANPVRYCLPAMMHPYRLWFLVSAFLFVEPLLAFDAAGQPSHGVLVLRNGEVLAGTTTKVGDRYVIARNDGTELRIPTGEVEMHCRDLNEAYARKRHTVSRRDVSAVLQLADWCLRNGLHARAADELLAASEIAPRDPRIQSLQRRLQVAMTPESSREVPHRQVPPVANPSPPRQPPLERLHSTMPAEAIENFTSRVQPLLLNRCATAACHGGRSSSEFQLASPGLGKTATLRYTQRNLAAIVQQINAVDPAASPLLTVPQRPHGGLSSGVFSDRDRAQMDILEKWVLKTIQSMPSQSIFAESLSAQSLNRDTRQVVSVPDATGELAATLPSGLLNLAHGSPNEPSMVDFRDPFDPERFNRRFLPRDGEQEVPPPAKVLEGPGS